MSRRGRSAKRQSLKNELGRFPPSRSDAVLRGCDVCSSTLELRDWGSTLLKRAPHPQTPRHDAGTVSATQIAAPHAEAALGLLPVWKLNFVRKDSAPERRWYGPPRRHGSHDDTAADP